MLLAFFLVTAVQIVQASSTVVVYPEIQPHLQKYQDFGWGFPEIGEWILVQRNYYEDFLLGGHVKSIKQQKYGRNTPQRAQIVITYDNDLKVSARLTLGSSEGYTTRNILRMDLCQSNATIEAHVIFWEPYNCLIIRHHYIRDGYGCTYWRHFDALNKPDDCCQFIYAENCGTSPMYQIYDLPCLPGSRCGNSISL